MARRRDPGPDPCLARFGDLALFGDRLESKDGTWSLDDVHRGAVTGGERTDWGTQWDEHSWQLVLEIGDGAITRHFTSRTATGVTWHERLIEGNHTRDLDAANAFVEALGAAFRRWQEHRAEQAEIAAAEDRERVVTEAVAAERARVASAATAGAQARSAEVTTPDDPCCDTMGFYLAEDPPTVMGFHDGFLGLPYRDGTGQVAVIAYCPWCGVASNTPQLD